MPDLSIETAATCATNTGWSTTVIGSKGAEYIVRWNRQFTGPVQYDYECSCPLFKNRGTPCKHIRQVQLRKLRCGWNAALEPTLKAEDEKCPNCGGPVEYFKVGV